MTGNNIIPFGHRGAFKAVKGRGDSFYELMRKAIVEQPMVLPINTTCA